jgi:hypothetical protein
MVLQSVAHLSPGRPESTGPQPFVTAPNRTEPETHNPA